MMPVAGDMESYLSVLDDNHFELVKYVDPEVFLDYMRQHRVLSEDDCQIIQNHFINATRRARMRCFLDIIRAKGPDNIQLFLQQLGWEYPHVYREIFRKEPSVPPESYRQDTKSRLSCDLNQLLTVGLDMTRLRNQREDLTYQIRDMEAMLRHQKNEIEDLERENQRLRQYERDSQQNKERIRTLNTKNEEIKEENRQFLHEIRTLNMEVQKRRDQEAILQANLDEMTQQIQEKSFELNMKNREENDLRAKYEHVRKESMKFQTVSKGRRGTDLATQVKLAQHAARQSDMEQQLEILTDDMKSLEETNRDLCEQLRYLQNLLDTEKEERDQMHRRVCVLEHDKNNLENRQVTSVQKIERYFNKIKELEDQKRKLEEERMHMQNKIWELQQQNEKQFEQQHNLENRYDYLQQNFEQFRQDHRYCVQGEPQDNGPRPRLTAGVDFRPGRRSPALSPLTGKSDPFAKFASFRSPNVEHEDNTSSASDNHRPHGILISNSSYVEVGAERSESMAVHISASMRKKHKQEDDALTESDDEKASTVSELSSVSSSTFDFVDMSDIPNEVSSSLISRQASSGDPTVTGNFFVRSNTKDEGDGENMMVQEGDILYVVQTGQEFWKVMGVDKTNGKLIPDIQGKIQNPDSPATKVTRRNVPGTGGSKPQTLERKGGIRRDGLRHQQSFVNAFTSVYPMKASRLLPVLMLCPLKAMKSMLSCMETAAQGWAHVIPDGQAESSTELFSESLKHKVLTWEGRPKDTQKFNKFIIIAVTLGSQDAVSTLKLLLGEPDLTIDYDQETKYVNERYDFAIRAGFHSETVKIMAGQDSREAFWNELKEKVSLVQQRIFWLESPPAV